MNVNLFQPVDTMQTNRIRTICMLVGLFVLMAPLTSTAGIEDIDLPHSPKKWVNGGPYAQEALKNKTVVFYFFEED